MTELAVQSASPSAGAARRGIAQVLYAPHGRFKKTILLAGDSLTFGRDERAKVQLRDQELRGSHFDVFFDGLEFTVREHGQGQLLIDGKPSYFGRVRSGGFVVAGHTTVRFFLERRTPALPNDLIEQDKADAIVATLNDARNRGSLYAVLDAARDPRIRTLLDESVDEHASLYEGTKGAVLDDVAPYMVRLRSDSQLLERLVREGWGQAWGVFFDIAEPWKLARRHLRRFLMVLDDQASERMYFRFYDPRVMREFMKIATPRQRSQLLLGVGRLVVEADDLSLLSWSGEPDGMGENEQAVGQSVDA